MTLGELIKHLEVHLSDSPDADVQFDFCGVKPSELYSYRGSYDQIAISWTDGSRVMAADFLKELRAAIGKTFTGWKGGGFVMDTDTEIWVDQCGKATGTRIVGTKMMYSTITIVTEQTDD
ncbi:MAG: hypothetical protein KIT88_10175 [Phycisphaeraceae bacterium]|nr:hypothetical protein [Phycisphaeraceae bacterium]